MLSLSQVLKMLIGNSKSVLAALGAIEREHPYEVEDVVFNYAHGSINMDWFLECTTAGVTGTAEIAIPENAQSGDTITDGEVVWKLFSMEDYLEEPFDPSLIQIDTSKMILTKDEPEKSFEAIIPADCTLEVTPEDPDVIEVTVKEIQ
jgi:hypothetical protein